LQFLIGRNLSSENLLFVWWVAKKRKEPAKQIAGFYLNAKE